jgi:hypothetical protein
MDKFSAGSRGREYFLICGTEFFLDHDRYEVTDTNWLTGIVSCAVLEHRGSVGEIESGCGVNA